MAVRIQKEDVVATLATPEQIANIIDQAFKMARFSPEAMSPALFFRPGTHTDLSPKVYKMIVVIEEVQYP